MQYEYSATDKGNQWDYSSESSEQSFLAAAADDHRGGNGNNSNNGIVGDDNIKRDSFSSSSSSYSPSKSQSQSQSGLPREIQWSHPPVPLKEVDEQSSSSSSSSSSLHREDQGISQAFESQSQSQLQSQSQMAQENDDGSDDGDSTSRLRSSRQRSPTAITQPSPPTAAQQQHQHQHQHQRQGAPPSSSTPRTVPELLSPDDVLRRIERLTQSIVQALAEERLPKLTALTAATNTAAAAAASHDANESDSDASDDGNDSGDGGDDGSDDSTTEEQDNANAARARHAVRVVPKRVVVFHNLSQSRKFSSILLVLSFCHTLLLAQRTTTIREVFYYYVTHFRSQSECDAAIVDACNLLRIPRSSLGLFASPKGWYCGCLQVILRQEGNHNRNRNHNPNHKQGRGQQLSQRPIILDGQAQSSVSIQGSPITQEWLKPAHQRGFDVDCFVHPHSFVQNNRDDGDGNSDDNGNDNGDGKNNHSEEEEATPGQTQSPPLRAKCILVIEKEGVYNRLSEDRIYERYPCILVTGKGFPDLATRSLVYTLHHELKLPVYGLADCNPFGILVLQTYQFGSLRRGVDGGSRYSVPIQWLGLRPSHVVMADNDESDDDTTASTTSSTVLPLPLPLPAAVYQQMTALDEKRLDRLLEEDHRFHNSTGIRSGDYNATNVANDKRRYEELELMRNKGTKVELEALNWLGMEYMTNWVIDILTRHDRQLLREQTRDQQANRNDGHEQDERSEEDSQSDEEEEDDENMDDAPDDSSAESH